MELNGKQTIVTTAGTSKTRLEKLRRAGRVYLGIDIGSTSSDIAILDENNSLVYADYRRTRGRPLKTLRSQLADITDNISIRDINLAAATGSGARSVAELLDIPFVNEVPAQAAAVWRLYPDLKQATVIEMGGQDSKLIFLCEENGKGRVRDFALNSVCAAGTGSFLDQQAQRLGIDIERQFAEMALQSKNVPRMAGRCSVFAKSDMIHLQQQATPTCDILAGLCLALARNLKSNLGCGREFVKPVIFTGGVASNLGVVRALENVLELPEQGLSVPEEHLFTGACGAVLVAKSRGIKASGRECVDLHKLDSYLSESGTALKRAPRREPLREPAFPVPNSYVYENLLDEADRPIDAYVGLDVGSLSTNVVVMDEDKRILAKAYLMTEGRPLEAVKKGLDIVARKVSEKVNIIGAASTGSGRYLTGDFIGADVVINEITAQAAGAAIVNPDVDTIFEIGGQDSKYISLENGVVVDFEMNHACAAGTGSFLEEQAQRLQINIDKEFAQRAFKSKSPIKLGERCTVFMESDLLNYQQQGASTEELLAGLSYSIVANYLNRVVGRRKIGDNICFQGGTAFNKAVWAAFEKVTGKPVMVPDHHEVTGALGAASIVAESMKKRARDEGQRPRTKFRGFKNLVKIDYTVESFTCPHCPNHCEVKKVQLPGSEPLYYGSRCDRYNLKKKKASKDKLGAFEYRWDKMIEYAGLSEKPESSAEDRPTVGIPLALVNWELLPLFSRFFKTLGFDVVVSEKTDKQTIRRGIETVTAQTCFPVKLAYGHIAELIENQVDYVFLPSIVSMIKSFPESENDQLCPYVQSIGFQAQTAFEEHLGKTKIITTPLRLGEGWKFVKKSFAQVAKQMDIRSSRVSEALNEAYKAQEGFKNALKEKGRDILDQLGADDKLYILVSRPYNGCDDGLNLQLPKKLAELGVKTMPVDMLELEKAPLSDESLHQSTYWTYGQKILRAAEIIKRDPRLFGIYLSNFSCGPDSFIQTFFKDIMGDKPSLQLEIDEHSADAGVITRLEAFLESLKNYTRMHQASGRPTQALLKSPGMDGQRSLYIPYMGDCSYGLAACMRAYGQDAEVIPLADESALIKGRAYTSGKECLPCAITSGDMLKMLDDDDFNKDQVAFFMPGANGPCRFGMYNCLQKLILKYAGVDDVPVIAPNQESSFYSELTKTFRVASKSGFMRYAWISIIGIDLMHKVIMRLRPYAKDPDYAQQVYERLRGRWVRAIEKKASLTELKQLMAEFADCFGRLELDKKTRKPRIGIVGEIYVRSHPFANLYLINRLEKLGAACDLAPLAEWIYYTNFTRRREAQRKGKLKDRITNNIQDHFQRKIEKELAQPLEKYFGELAEEPVENVLELAKPYLHVDFEGEAILTIGKAIEYHHRGFGGVINVMPFSCMPSTIVSTQSRKVSAQCDGMPILNISFDGQEDPTMTTRLEAFVEQIRQRQKGVHSIAELVETV